MDPAMDTRWPYLRPADSKPSGRRANARLIIKGFTDPDLLDIESHSPTLAREGFMTFLQSMCSHGHKLQFGNVQQAFTTGDPIKREQPLFVRMPPDGVPSDISRSLGAAAHNSYWTGRWHEREGEELFPCYCQRTRL